MWAMWDGGGEARPGPSPFGCSAKNRVPRRERGLTPDDFSPIHSSSAWSPGISGEWRKDLWPLATARPQPSMGLTPNKGLKCRDSAQDGRLPVSGEMSDAEAPHS